MIFNDVAKLIQQTFTVNEAGDSIPTETESTVFVCVKSIGMKRKLEAEAFGLKLEFKFILSDEAEYHGEEIVEYNGTRYNVVDVYVTENHQVELTVKRY